MNVQNVSTTPDTTALVPGAPDAAQPAEQERPPWQTWLAALGAALLVGAALLTAGALVLGPRLLAEAYERLGSFYLERGELDLAVTALDRAIEHRPEGANAYNLRGVAYARQGDINKAFADFDQAIRLAPDFGKAYLNRGLAHLDRDRPNLAVADFTKAASLLPKNATVYFWRGLAHMQQGHAEQAIADFDEALLLDPDMVGAYFHKATIHSAHGRYGRAIEEYDRYLQRAPNDPAALNGRCWAHFKLSEFELALPDCERALELAPNYVNALDSRARVYLGLGRTAEAVADFERILELDLDPGLSRQAEAALQDIAEPEATSLEITQAAAGINLARGKPARASRELRDFPAREAVDGNRGNWWSAGDFAPHWLVVDLGANYVIAEVRLLPAQSPAGRTTHEVYGKGPATNNEYELLHTFAGLTADNRWLTFEPPEPLQGIRYIRVETVSSPSWVGWREIEVIAGE